MEETKYKKEKSRGTLAQEDVKMGGVITQRAEVAEGNLRLHFPTLR